MTQIRGGTYLLTYNVSDTAGNPATQVVRTVNVIPDTTAPVISLIGASTINLNVGDVYTEEGATAIDDLDGDITANIIIGGDTVNTSSGGTYLVTYDVGDAAGNPATQVVRTVNVIPDTAAPVITLNGVSTINLNVGDVYTEEGATAIDDLDGDISVNIVIGGDAVNTSVGGTYLVTYDVSDTAGNPATQVVRTVNVIPDTTAPVITLNGASPIDLNLGDSYTELGATASDNIDGDISVNIIIGGDTVNSNSVGTYSITYNVSDAAGNSAIEVKRTVNVLPDVTIPVITLIGQSFIDLNVGSAYIEQGATAIDNFDGDLTSNIVITDNVNPFSAGTYFVNYNVTDSSGNIANTVTRTVNVISDSVAPTMTLIGSSVINLSIGDAYTEQGATASDNIDGDITSSIVIGGDTVNTNIAGTYNVTYNVSDSAGNAATQLSRSVIVTAINTGCSGGIASFPYSEGFENTLGGWTQSSSDDLDWTIDANGTPSGNTGPSSATEGSFYVYVEASGNGTGYPDKRAILTSPCFDLSSLPDATFSFKYHMFGATNMGTIDLEISDDNGSNWSSIWNQSGNQGNSWLTVSVDLAAYIGSNIQLRFNRVVGNTWQADIAIDDISLFEPVTPTCFDGVQNGDETGVDCGGSSCLPCTNNSVVIHEGYFETGLDGWIDGGSDCARVSSANSFEGTYSVRIRDNSGVASSMTSPTFDLLPYDEVEFDFYFYSFSMESGEDFWLQYNDGSGFVTVETWARGTDFVNNAFDNFTVTLNTSQFNLSSNAQFRLICDASGNNDQIFIDQVVITGFGSGLPLLLKDVPQTKVNSDVLDVAENTFLKNKLTLYPNPVGNVLSIKTSKGGEMTFKIINSLGQIVNTGKTSKDILVDRLEAGMYFIEVTNDSDKMMKRFIKE